MTKPSLCAESMLEATAFASAVPDVLHVVVRHTIPTSLLACIAQVTVKHLACWQPWNDSNSVHKTSHASALRSCGHVTSSIAQYGPTKGRLLEARPRLQHAQQRNDHCASVPTCRKASKVAWTVRQHQARDAFSLWRLVSDLSAST